MSEQESLEQRIVTLETSLAYLQHDLEQINQVVFEQQKQLEALSRKLERFEEKFGNTPPDLPHPYEDRPPHY